MSSYVWIDCTSKLATLAVYAWNDCYASLDFLFFNKYLSEELLLWGLCPHAPFKLVSKRLLCIAIQSQDLCKVKLSVSETSVRPRKAWGPSALLAFHTGLYRSETFGFTEGSSSALRACGTTEGDRAPLNPPRAFTSAYGWCKRGSRGKEAKPPAPPGTTQRK